jgi:hypothetical protein
MLMKAQRVGGCVTPTHSLHLMLRKDELCAREQVMDREGGVGETMLGPALVASSMRRWIGIKILCSWNVND